LTYVLHEEYTLKGATIATRAASKWGGVMIKLSGLSPCLVILSVIFVCYQSVIRNSNNISGYVYNREFINQLTPVSHSPSKFKF